MSLILYSLDQTPQLLFISSRNFVRLLFKSSYYSRAVFIKLGTEDDEIHCLKESGWAADARESIQRGTVMLATAMDTEFEEADPFAELKMTKMSACFGIAIESRCLFMCTCTT